MDYLTCTNCTASVYPPGFAYELVPHGDMQSFLNLPYTRPVSRQISPLAGSGTNKQIKKHSAATCLILFGKIWSQADKKSRSCSTH